ncbi:MAG TPA: dihydrodipicolinate synthase family protein [Opitutaceae bacterium]|nr:dihydrodipicolinate synthase family protein [Opitutaceae bacterium]
MAPTFRPRGIYSAQWIPVDADGQLDRVALADHIGFERRNGISGLLALGSTGEFPFFSPADRKVAIDAIATSAGDLPLVVNVSDIRPAVAVEIGRHACAAGAKAIAVMPPMFYPVSQPDMLAYFLRVSEGVDLPVMLYNFPELTGKKISLETIAAFAVRAPMCGIKQSGAEFAYHRDLVALGRQAGFVVVSGADTRLPEVFALGAAGCIGGLVNVVPEVMVEIYRRSASNGSDMAPLAALMVEVGRIVDQLTFPLNVAAGLEARGFNPGVAKSVVSGESQALYRRIVGELRELLRRIPAVLSERPDPRSDHDS